MDTTEANVEETNFAEALSERYLAYALSTIMSRSLPDVFASLAWPVLMSRSSRVCLTEGRARPELVSLTPEPEPGRGPELTAAR